MSRNASNAAGPASNPRGKIPGPLTAVQTKSNAKTTWSVATDLVPHAVTRQPAHQSMTAAEISSEAILYIWAMRKDVRTEEPRGEQEEIVRDPLMSSEVDGGDGGGVQGRHGTEQDEQSKGVG